MFGYGVQPLTCRLMISKGEVQFAGNPGVYYKHSESATSGVVKQLRICEICIGNKVDNNIRGYLLQ